MFLILFPENAKLRLFNKTVLGIIFISGLTFNDMVYNITAGSYGSTDKPSALGVCHGSSEMTNLNGCPVSQWVWHAKEPSLLYECKICSPSPEKVTSPNERNILGLDEKSK